MTSFSKYHYSNLTASEVSDKNTLKCLKLSLFPMKPLPSYWLTLPNSIGFILEPQNVLTSRSPSQVFDGTDRAKIGDFLWNIIKKTVWIQVD